MNREEALAHMTDYLDGLLEEERAREVEERIAREPALLAEAARRRALLHRPYAVPAPAPGMQERILQRARRRPVLRLVRYAATFAAGVLTALLLTLREAPAPAEPAPEEVRSERSDDLLVLNRRIQ